MVKSRKKLVSIEAGSLEVSASGVMSLPRIAAGAERLIGADLTGTQIKALLKFWRDFASECIESNKAKDGTLASTQAAKNVLKYIQIIESNLRRASLREAVLYALVLVSMVHQFTIIGNAAAIGSHEDRAQFLDENNERRKVSGQRRSLKYQRLADDIWAKNPNLSVSRVAARIALELKKSGQTAKPGTIRRVIRLPQK
jgi:hypothetical protein